MSLRTATEVESVCTTGGVGRSTEPTLEIDTVDIDGEGSNLPGTIRISSFSLFSTNTANVCCVMALWALLAFYYAFIFIIPLSIPYSLDYEGHVVWACDKLAHFQNIYAPELLTQQPFAVTMYNPLFMALGAMCNRLAGHEFSHLRSISVLSTIYCFIGIYSILRNRCRISAFNAAMATGFFASYLSVFYWSHVARVDMLGLAFAIWGLERFALAFEAAEKRSARDKTIALTLSIFLFVCAYFTKQQYFILPVAAALFCFLERRRNLGFTLLGTFFGAALSIGFILQLVTGGYLAHLTYASGLQWEWATLSSSLVPFLCDPKTVAIGVVLFASLFVRASSTRFDRLAIIIVALALPLALYTMGLRGAFHNHLLTLELAICWLAATRLARFSPSLTTFVLALALFATIGLPESSRDFTWRLSTAMSNSETLEKMRKLDLLGKRVLFEDASVALALGAEPDFVDVTTLFNTTSGAAAKTEAVCASIERKEYAAIMINARDNLFSEIIWPKCVVRAIKKNYKSVDYPFGANGEKQAVYISRSVIDRSTRRQ